jgi:hypothetical protein
LPNGWIKARANMRVNPLHVQSILVNDGEDGPIRNELVPMPKEARKTED